MGHSFTHRGGFYPASVIQALLPLLPLLLPPQEEDFPLTGLPVQDAVVDAIYAEENIQVMETLDELVNGIGPRLTSSSNLQEASRARSTHRERNGRQGYSSGRCLGTFAGPKTLFPTLRQLSHL